MKRVLVVDDEQPVVDHIVRLIERHLSDEFEVVGTASSGRQTLDKVPVCRPDIVVLDVRMPGLSGLETIRELQRRGAVLAYVLSTAYERFDIAREALELGVTGYLLKPVSREALTQALRAAAAQMAPPETEHAPDAERPLFDAYLLGLMVGRPYDAATQALRDQLGLTKPWGLVAAVAFRHDAEATHAALDSLVQYKSEAWCGPLVHGQCLLFLPLQAAADAPEARASLEALVRSAPWGHPGHLACGWADARPAAELSLAWPLAVARLAGSDSSAGGSRWDPEVTAAFWSALVPGQGDALRQALETLLAPLEVLPEVPVADRFRVLGLLAAALDRLVAHGLLEESVARTALELDDLRQASQGPEFCLLARARFPILAAALGQAARWSPPLAAALDYVRAHLAQPLALDTVAEAVGVTPKRLSRYFIDEIGQGFSEVLIDLRIERAKVLLVLPGATIKQVSLDCGYTDPNYFARLFKKVTGSTPSEFAAEA